VPVLDVALRNEAKGISIAFTLSRNVDAAPAGFLKSEGFGAVGDFSSRVTPKAANVSTSIRPFTSEAHAYSPATKSLVSVSIVRDGTAGEVSPAVVDFATGELIDVLIS